VLNSYKTANIPKEFTLFGHKYTIRLEKDLLEKENCYGNADEDMKLIRLQDIGKVIRKYEEDGQVYETEIEITENTLTETFFHEMIHIILDASGEEELSENEKFVNISAKSMLEIYLSSVYEKESKP